MSDDHLKLAKVLRLTEDQLWHIHFVLSMNLDRDTLAIVEHRNLVLLGVNIDLNQVHGAVTLEVIGGVDQNLI